MQYHELRQKAKEYNNIFHYTFNKSSWKKPWIYIGTLSFMAMVFFMVVYVIKKPLDINRGIAFGIAIIFEVIGIFSFIWQQEISRRVKLQNAGFSITPNWSVLDEIKCQEKWLKNNLKISSSNYLELVHSINKFEEELKNHTQQTKSIFDKSLSFISHLPGILSKAIAVITVIAAPIIIKDLMENDSWVRKSLDAMGDSIAVTLIIGIPASIIIIFLASFIISIFAAIFDYISDVLMQRGCSDSSMRRLKRDLIYFSPIKWKAEDTKPPIKTR